jgi:hypothetical protein
LLLIVPEHRLLHTPLDEGGYLAALQAAQQGRTQVHADLNTVLGTQQRSAVIFRLHQALLVLAALFFAAPLFSSQSLSRRE